MADLVTFGGSPTLFGRASGQGRPVVPLRARQYHSKTSLAQSVTQVHLRQRQHINQCKTPGSGGKTWGNKNHGTACRPKAHLGSLLPHATPAMQLTEVLTQAKKWGCVAHHWRGHLTCGHMSLLLDVGLLRLGVVVAPSEALGGVASLLLLCRQLVSIDASSQPLRHDTTISARVWGSTAGNSCALCIRNSLQGWGFVELTRLCRMAEQASLGSMA